MESILGRNSRAGEQGARKGDSHLSFEESIAPAAASKVDIFDIVYLTSTLLSIKEDIDLIQLRANGQRAD
jgi:hypothetical protein